MPGKQAKAVSPSMLKRMLRKASQSVYPARDRTMILLSVKAGLWACEIARLDWSMVLDARGKVAVLAPRPTLLDIDPGSTSHAPPRTLDPAALPRQRAEVEPLRASAERGPRHRRLDY